MRVALLTNNILPYRLPLYRALSEKIDEFRIFLSAPMEPGGCFPIEWRGLDIKVQKSFLINTKWKHPHGFTEILEIHFPYNTLSQLLSYKPDVVISAELGARSIQSLIYKYLARRTKLVIWALYSSYTEQNRGFLRRGLRKYILRRADAVMVNGKSGSNYVQTLGVSPDKISYAPYSVDSQYFQVPVNGEGERSHRLLYVGQLIERKGLVQFFHVLKKWCEKNPDRRVEFWVVGDGPLRPKLASSVYPPNLSVKFHGFVEYSQLAWFYAECGIFVFPTLADEWGVVVNEAVASGLPVLGSIYSQAVEELIEEKKTGWIFRPDDPKQGYQALNEALSTPTEKLSEMRVAAREAVNNYTPQNISDNIYDVIKFTLIKKN